MVGILYKPINKQGFSDQVSKIIKLDYLEHINSHLIKSGLITSFTTES